MSIGKIREFDVQSGSWISYCERLESYFVVNDVKEERKLPTLISAVGDAAYELMVNLCSPKKPAEKTFKEVVEIMGKHLEPAPSVLAERFKFRQYRQVKGQTVAQYVAELKKMARFCCFEETLDENMRDQFVCGLYSDLIRQRLFAENKITFAKSVSLALSLEAAERDSVAVERGGGGAAVGVVATEAQIASVHSIRSAPAGCMACGDFRHQQAQCKFSDYECSRCKVKGHLRRMCPTMIGAGGPEFSGTRGNARGGATGSSTGYGQNRGMRYGPATAATSGSGGSGARGGRAGGRGRNRWGNSRMNWVDGSNQLEQEEVPFDDDEGLEEPIYQMSLDQYKPA